MHPWDEVEVVVGLVLAAAEELVDHAEPAEMSARPVASVENFIAVDVLFLLYSTIPFFQRLI